VASVGGGMGVLDGLVIVEGEGALLGVYVGRRLVTNTGFCDVVVLVRVATQLFPNYSGRTSFVVMQYTTLSSSSS